MKAGRSDTSERSARRTPCSLGRIQRASASQLTAAWAAVDDPRQALQRLGDRLAVVDGGAPPALRQRARLLHLLPHRAHQLLQARGVRLAARRDRRDDVSLACTCGTGCTWGRLGRCKLQPNALDGVRLSALRVSDVQGCRSRQSALTKATIGLRPACMPEECVCPPAACSPIMGPDHTPGLPVKASRTTALGFATSSPSGAAAAANF